MTDNITQAEAALLSALTLLNKERVNRDEKEARINQANKLLDQAHTILRELDTTEGEAAW